MQTPEQYLSKLELSCERATKAYIRTSYEVEQALGKALGYPWYKDDQKNFPGATEADGVCVGEHIAVTIAREAARKITELKARVAELEKEQQI